MSYAGLWVERVSLLCLSSSEQFGSDTVAMVTKPCVCIWPAGKTTVTQSVSDTLGAVLLKSPPACISQWRKIFDDEPTIIRRAFYSLGNYIVASEIAKESTKSPVIIDR